MNPTGRQHRESVQLDLGMEPLTFLDAVGRVVADLAISPRTIAACAPIDRPDALLWTHRWVEQCDAVVDLGCGLGGASAFLHQRRSGSLTLVDSAQAAVAHASQFTGLPVLTAELDGLPFRDDSFGGAVALSPHGHRAERAGMLPEIGRVVRRGGRVALWTCVSNTESPFDSDRARYPTLSQLEAELYAAGLDVEAWVVADRFDVDPTWRDIHRSTRKSVSDRYSSIAGVERELAEAEVVAGALNRGELTSLLYRLDVR